MTIAAADIVTSLDVTGIAAIPNQIHHEVRSTKHIINVALIGDDGLGKTGFINRCLKQKVFEDKACEKGDPMIEIRLRKAELVEAGFKASLTIVDVPNTGLTWDRNTSYKALLQYGIDQIEEYHRIASQIDRPLELDLVDPRLSVALFFINGLTTRRLSTLELGALAELSNITKTIVVIGKADCLLQEELQVLRSTIDEQLRDTDIGLFCSGSFAVSRATVATKESPLDTFLFSSLMPDILKEGESN